VKGGITRQIPYLMMGDYFGVPGPDKASMLRWNRTIFWDIFLDLKQDPTIRANALESSKEMLAYLHDLTQEKKREMKAGILPNDSMLARLLAMQGGEKPSFTDQEIPGNLSGTYMGFLEPTNKAMVNILRQFFARPDVLAQAREAALADDAERMLGLAMEAMRFHPNGPLLMRHSPKEQYIGGHNGRKKRRIPAGKTLYLMTQSAMFDPRAVEKPERFNPHRPREIYLYFGYGLHTCFGNYINYVSIPEMLISLLKRTHLKPAAKPVFEGPFPDQWQWLAG
jgi:cytochrome P450